MIKASDAIAYARQKIGTPYGSGKGELDCINLIKAVIRNAPGGIKNYTDAGTASLWASYNSSGKYKHLTAQIMDTCGALPGMLAFKGMPLGRDGQPHHVGIVTELGTVVHASSAAGMVVETSLDGQWTLLGVSRYIEPNEDEPDADPDHRADDFEENQGESEENMGEIEKRLTPFRAIVVGPAGSNDVFLRRGPGKEYVWFQRVPIGAEIMVAGEFPGWDFILWDTYSGYMSAEFVQPAPPDDPAEPVPEETAEPEWLEDPTFVSETGAVIKMFGRWRIAQD